MHMAVRGYANETGQIFTRKFDYFRKTTQPFLMCFKEIIFFTNLKVKVIIYDKVYVNFSLFEFGSA